MLRTFLAGFALAATLCLGSAIAQPETNPRQGENVAREPLSGNFTGRVISIQVTGSGGDASQGMQINFENLPPMLVGADVRDGAFSAMASVILSSIELRCPLTGHYEVVTYPGRTSGLWQMTWVQLEAAQCRRRS